MESDLSTPKLRPSRIPLIFPNIPKGETIKRIEIWTEDTPRNHTWEVWKPKYGKRHTLALTEKGVYDITEDIEAQTK